MCIYICRVHIFLMNSGIQAWTYVYLVEGALIEELEVLFQVKHLCLVEIHGRMNGRARFFFFFFFTSASNPIPSKLQGCQSISSFVLLTSSTLSNWAGNRGHPPLPLHFLSRQIIPEVNLPTLTNLWKFMRDPLSRFVIIIFVDNLVVGSIVEK